MNAPSLATARLLDRRRLLGLGGGLTTATVLSGGTSLAGTDVAPSPRFAFDGAGGYLMLERELRPASWLMQSFAFDNDRQHTYVAVMQPHSDTGDLWISKTDLHGNPLGRIALHGFGQGVQIAVDPYADGVYLWVESHVNPSNGLGRRLARIRLPSALWTDGGTAIGVSDPTVEDRTPSFPATDGHAERTIVYPQPAIDPTTDRLLVRFRVASGPQRGQARVVAFSMRDARAGRLGWHQRLADWALPTRSDAFAKKYPFQGFTACGQYAYVLEGSPAAPDSTAYLTWVDLRTGKASDPFETKAGESFQHREPKGMAIHLADCRPRLTFGITSTVDGAFRSSIFYKSDRT